MTYSNETELLDKNLCVFPEASIAGRSKLAPIEIKKLEQGKRKLPARQGAGRATRRAGKHKQPNDSYWLFDLDELGGGK
jgi:hypothetical protein